MIFIHLLFFSSVQIKHYPVGDEIPILFAGMGAIGSPMRRVPSKSKIDILCPNCTATTVNGSQYSLLKRYHLYDIGVHLPFGQNQNLIELCHQQLDDKTTSDLQNLIIAGFWIECSFDSLPQWFMLGEFADSHTFIYTHFNFTVIYNADFVLNIRVTPMSPVELIPGSDLLITYSSSWAPSVQSPASRLISYSAQDFFVGKVNKARIIWALIIAVTFTLTASLSIFKVVRTDISQSRGDLDFDDFESERSIETGWRSLHADVFRNPPRQLLLASLSASGCFLFAFAGVYAFLIYAFDFSRHPEALLPLAIVAFIALSTIPGYVVSSLSHVEFPKSILPSLLCSIVILTILVEFESQSLATSILEWAIFSFLSSLMSLFGSFLATSVPLFDRRPPCDVAMIPRAEPPLPLYLKNPIASVIFAVVCYTLTIDLFNSMYYSLWQLQLKKFFLSSFLALFVIALITSILSILLVYLSFRAGTHQWHWRSFVFPSLYGVFFLAHRLVVTSALSSSDCLIALSLSLMCSSIGYVASLFFTRLVFRNLKIE